MTSFFEKLKKGMDVKEVPEEIPEVKEKKKVKKKGTKIKVKKEPLIVEPVSKSFTLQNLGGQEGELTVDVYQTGKEIVIQSAIAGVKPEDLDISIENDMLIIKGVREKPAENEERNYFYQECYWGPFSRKIVLSEEVDCSRIQASIQQGILTIRIPKIKRRTNTKITVE